MGWFHSLLLLGTKPKNPTEEALLAFLRGKASLDHWISALRAAQLSLLIRGQAEAAGSQGTLSPLVIDGSQGPALCVFTHPDRALAMRRSAPDYQGLVTLPFDTVVKFTLPDMGWAFNAGSFFSTEVVAAGIEELRGSAGPPSA